MKALEEEGGAEKGNRSSFKETGDEDDDDDDDGEVNIDEDETAEDGGNKKSFVNATTQPKISVSVVAKKASEQAAPAVVHYDYTHLDQLFSMLDSDLGGEDIEPILCGYFNKVVMALVSKLKSRVLPYLLVKREGDVFSKLLLVLQHHSLAQLLVELLQLKIGPATTSASKSGASGGLLGGANRGFAFGSHTDSEEEDKEGEEVKLTPEEARMAEVLGLKRQEVVATLIERLGCPADKKEDLENCLNANMVLSELAESEQLYPKLVEAQNLQRLAQHACDTSNPHQPYALNVLATILKEYPNN